MFLKTFKQLLGALVNEQGHEVHKTATATLGVFEQNCYVVTSSGGAAVTITLPKSSQCAGLIYHVCLSTKDTYDVTVSGDGATIGTLDTTGDWILVISTGQQFRIIGGLYT